MSTNNSANYVTEVRYDDPYWDDMRVSPENVRFGSASPASFVEYKGSAVLKLANAATNTVQFEFQMPHAWLEGTDVDLHIHATAPSNDAGNIRWQVTHSWANIDDVMPGETTVLTTLPGTAIADTHTISELALIAGTGKTMSSILLVSISRIGADGLDTSTVDAYIMSIDLHYQINTPGSAQEYVKY